MAHSKIKLTYFELDGRAEMIRLILTWAGKEFEDFRFSRDKWPEFKPSTPFGQVPFVEIDGKVYAQSLAIANYFAREFGLYGKSNIDALEIEQFSHLVEDFTQEFLKYFREKDEAKKAELLKKVNEEISPKFLGFFEKLVNKNKGPYFLGNDPSLADIIIYDLATGFMKKCVEGILSKFPSLKLIAERIGSNARIKSYAATQK